MNLGLSDGRALPRTLIRRLSTAVLATLVAAPAVMSINPTPVAAACGVYPPWCVELTASTTSPAPGQSVTFTATTNNDVGPTPYFIEISDVGTGHVVADCGAGTSCSGTDTESGPHTYEAQITDGQAVSSPVTVIWPLPSSACTQQLTELNTEGLHVKLYFQQPDANDLLLCVRVDDVTLGTGLGGAFAIAGPTVTGGGVTGGPPTPQINSLGVPGAPDSNSAACATTTGNQVPGTHPIVSLGLAGHNLGLDSYLTYDTTLGGTAWVCLSLDGTGLREVVPLPGFQINGKLPVVVPPTVTPPSVTFTPDPGTP